MQKILPNPRCSGPAPSQFTDKIYEISTSLTEYKICSDLVVDITKLGEQAFSVDGQAFTVVVIDGVADYRSYMSELFDFDAIKALFCGERKLNLLINAMHGGLCSVRCESVEATLV